MKVLVLGSGAREHAIVRALSQDPDVTQIHVAPGNAGIAADAVVHALDLTDAMAPTALASELGIDLVIIGPEGPLVIGAADRLREAGINVFGPSGAAAQLEGSKAFAKEIMAEAGVPTALAHVCDTRAEVEAALDQFGAPYVVKDDGLAAGKGVVVTDDRAEAIEHALSCFEKQDGRVVIEEYLDGPEVSLLCITDGLAVIPLLPAQDFKRVFDGDLGPNTGGMGAYAPLPWAPAGMVEEVVARVVQPTVDELRHRGTPFCGVVYAGLALTSRGVRVIEFNARFGDPETQVVLALLKTQLSHVLEAAATGHLADFGPLAWHEGSAVTVVVAAENYPANPMTGDVVTIQDGLGEAYVLHAGTKRDEHGAVVTAGGRVLSVVATGASLGQARENVYVAVNHVEIRGSHHRSDIALAAAEGRVHVPS